MTEEIKQPETITMKRSTYIKMIVAVVFIVGFFAGFLTNAFVGGGITGFFGGTTTTGSQTVTPSGNTGNQGQTPGQVQVSADDDPAIGNKNAKVYVIEFSDFQCPFCRRFREQTLSQIDNDYIKTGKVYFVYRDFPLEQIHPAAIPAALAAECADEQGKFWEYHDIIFAEQQKQGSGTIQYDADDLKQWAAQVDGLNTQQFNQCLDSQKYAQEVQKDFQDGATAGVQGTPTFFIGSPQKGWTPLVGAQPYSAFKAAIDQALAQA